MGKQAQADIDPCKGLSPSGSQIQDPQYTQKTKGSAGAFGNDGKPSVCQQDRIDYFRKGTPRRDQWNPG